MAGSTRPGIYLIPPELLPVLCQRRASTLIETIVALVILSGCLLLVTVLIQRSHRYQQRSESLLEAATFADKVMSNVRLWAKDGSNYDGDWNAWRNRAVSDPDFAQLSALVDVQTSGLRLLSPDNLTEQVFSAPRELFKASVLVRVQAGHDLSSPVGRITIWSTIAPPEPVVNGAHVEVTPSGGPMNFGDSRSFTATAYDGTGRVLPQCCFEWSLHNQGGEARSLGQSRDGRSYSIKFDVNRWNDLLVPPGNEHAFGDVRVEVEARIMGKAIIGSSAMTLLGP